MTNPQKTPTDSTRMKAIKCTTLSGPISKPTKTSSNRNSSSSNNSNNRHPAVSAHPESKTPVSRDTSDSTSTTSVRVPWMASSVSI